MAEITLKEAWGKLATFGAPVWCGVISAIIVFVIEIILYNNKMIFAGVEKKIQKAKEKGNVLKGYRVSCRYKDRDPQDKTANRMWIASYKYEIDGVEKEKQIISTSGQPPLYINLYYTDSKKVFTDHSGGNPFKIVLYIIPILVAYFVMKLMGYEV